MGIYKDLFNQVLIPKDFRLGFPPVDRARSRSTGRSTDVHKTCTTIWLVGWSTGRSTVREPCSLDLALVDRAVNRPESSALWIRPHRWAVDRWHNGQKSDRWPVDRAVDWQHDFLLCWTPTASFWRPIYWACFGLFCLRFEVGFKLVFPISLRGFLHLF